MKAIINTNFNMLFFYDQEIENGAVEIDIDCLSEFKEGEEVEVLKVLEKGEYSKTAKSYVIFNPRNKESTTVSAVFITLI